MNNPPQVLADTSAWVEFLRGTNSRACEYVRANVGALASTEPILFELLAGARPGRRTTELERLLLSQFWVPIEPSLDYRAAVDVFHVTRAAGRPPRSLQECLIAALALRRDLSVAHRDADFEHIASATGLRTEDLRD